MSRRNKLEKFAELLRLPNVFENFNSPSGLLSGKDGAEVNLAGCWKSEHFGNDHPLVLELACGRGEYTVGLARMYPDCNYIGIDIKGARIWKGARLALQEGLSNAAFLRSRIELLKPFFAEGEVDEIWITFPDPFLKKANRRLTAKICLDVYRSILRPGGIVHLKTDSPTMYRSTLESVTFYTDATLLAHTDDLYAGQLPLPELAIPTTYEQKHLAPGKAIRYVQFRMR